MSHTISGMGEEYNRYSDCQMLTIKGFIPFIQQAIDILDIIPISLPFFIADYGSSHGFNSMQIIKTIIKYLKESKKIENEKQILVIHNDLPKNNWTVLFELLNNDKSYFAVASGRSFYESCLPSKTLSIGFSANSIHWLSRRPCHLSNNCIFSRAQGHELVLFQEQARLDFTQFLQHRSCELHIGGILLLTIWCTDENGSTGCDQVLDLLYKCAQSLSLLTDQEILDYTIPIYIRLPSECLDFELFNRFSLKLVESTLKKNPIHLFDEYRNGQMTFDECAQIHTQMMRNWAESGLRQALEMNGRTKEHIENILHQYWSLFQKELKELYSNDIVTICDYYLILKKISMEI